MWFFIFFSSWKHHQYFSIDPVKNVHILLNSCSGITKVARNHATKHPHFAEKQAGHHKRVKKILWQNVHISLSRQQDITNGSKNPVTKCPHFAEKSAGHHKCVHKILWQKTFTFCWAGGRTSQQGPKIMRQNVHISLKSQLDILNMLKYPVTKCSHFAEQPAGHHKWVQNHVDMMLQSILSWVDNMSHVTKLSTLKQGWTKNTWTDRTGIRMSQGQIGTAEGLFGGQIVWVELSCGRFVCGRIVKAPIILLTA
jgi:hypothetical protein